MTAETTKPSELLATAFNTAMGCYVQHGSLTRPVNDEDCRAAAAEIERLREIIRTRHYEAINEQI